jgi:hypothetical protein
MSYRPVLAVGRSCMRVRWVIWLLVMPALIRAQTAYIYDANMGNERDRDGDRYVSEFDLSFDPDIATGSADVYADIYVRPAGQASFSYVTSTGTITVLGQATTYYSVTFAGGSFGVYDYRIDLHDAGTGALLDSYGPASDPQLSGHREETSGEDPALYIYDAYFSTVIDYDGDGFPSEFDLVFDPDAEHGDYRVFVKLYSRSSSQAGYTFVATSENIDISGTASVTYTIPLYGGDYGYRDYLIELYNAQTGILVDTYGPADDPDLSGHAEETPEQDSGAPDSAGCACGAGVSSAFVVAICLRGVSWRRRRRTRS